MRLFLKVFCLFVMASYCGSRSHAADPPFRAGAAIVDVTPKLGLSINGGMTDQLVSFVHDPLHARAIVLDDGQTRLALVIVDSCMLPKEVISQAKQRISDQSKIPPDHVLISATHTHSAPAAADVFQTDAAPDYVHFLAMNIALVVEQASIKLAPARIGYGFGQNTEHVFNRRWKKKPNTIPKDPFGRVADQVQMNPTPGSSDLIEPAGPVDPEIAVVAVQSLLGAPIAVLSAYGLHYVGGVGSGHVSADYYGVFASKLGQRLGATSTIPAFVAAMANGTSGDINNINFRTPREGLPPYGQINRVAEDLSVEVARVVKSLKYDDHVSLDAKTAEIILNVRQPSTEELTRAESILTAARGKPLVGLEEFYARETTLLAKFPARVPVTLQALRIGKLGIAAIPCEVFAEIGLEIKAKSRLQPAFTIELANGYNGYLPTKAQHALGGYETWRARSSYLEVDAAEKITQTILDLMEQLNKQAPKP